MLIYIIRAESRDCPSSSESISSSWWLFLNTRKLSVPTNEATSRDRKMFILLLSERGTLNYTRYINRIKPKHIHTRMVRFNPT